MKYFLLIGILFFWMLVPLSSHAGSVTYQYDTGGRLVSADYGNGNTLSYRYDDNGNLLNRTIGTIEIPSGFTPSPGGELGFDFNQDGRADLIVIDTTAKDVYLGFMSGTALIGAGRPGTIPAGWQPVGPGHYNGNPGLFLYNESDHTIHHVSMNSDQITAIEQVNILAGSHVPVWLADMNGSGTWDLITLDPDTQTVSVAFMDTDLPAAATEICTLEAQEMILFPADFTGDGVADLLVRDMTSGNISLMLSRSGAWKRTFFAQLPMEWDILGPGFFNADLKADMVIRYTPTGDTWIVYMDGAAVADVMFLGSIPVDWRFSHGLDTNADGISDMIWHHADTRQLAILQMSLSGISDAGILFVLPEGWQIIGH